MIYDSMYWTTAIALEPINNHEIVVLETDKDNNFTIRHARDEKDWIYGQAAYVNMPIYAYANGEAEPIHIKSGDFCRCLIIDITMK